jgi:hypothetical protein
MDAEFQRTRNDAMVRVQGIQAKAVFSTKAFTEIFPGM